MMFWTREVIGWALIGLGIIGCGITYFVFLRNGLIFQSGPMAFLSFIVFRGGIHLVKVAVAARLCVQLAEKPKPKPARSESARRPLPGQHPTASTLPILTLQPAERALPGKLVTEPRP